MIASPPPFTQSHFKETAASLPLVAKYSFQDYRHTLEDSVRDILAADLALPLSYKWTDVRLALGYASALLGLGVTGYAHMTGFATTKVLVTYTVLVYILLSVVTSVILMVYESKYLAEGALADGTQVTLATSISNDAEWKVEVVVTTAKGRKAVVRQAKGFGEYFSESGKLVGDKVYGDVCAWMQEAQTQLNK